MIVKTDGLFAAIVMNYDRADGEIKINHGGGECDHNKARNHHLHSTVLCCTVLYCVTIIRPVTTTLSYNHHPVTDSQQWRF